MKKLSFGNFLSKTGKFELETADNKKTIINKNLLHKIALKVIGIPHIGMRVRFRHILKMLNPKKNEIILDVGCGPGLYALYFSTRCSRVYAIDLNSEKIKKAKKLNKKLSLSANFKKGSITNLPYKDNFFDKVLCSEVLEHIKEDKIAMAELSRVTKKKGLIVLSIPSKNIFNQNNMEKFSHVRAGYSINEIKELAEKNNLVIIKRLSILSFFGKLSWRLNHKLFFSKILTTSLFFPLYWMALLDNLFNINENPIDYIFILQKNQK